MFKKKVIKIVIANAILYFLNALILRDFLLDTADAIIDSEYEKNNLTSNNEINFEEPYAKPDFLSNFTRPESMI